MAEKLTRQAPAEELMTLVDIITVMAAFVFLAAIVLRLL
jgi:hypothetical protein